MHTKVCCKADCYVIIEIIAILAIRLAKKTGLNDNLDTITNKILDTIKIKLIYLILDIHAFNLIGYVNDCTYYRAYRRIARNAV